FQNSASFGDAQLVSAGLNDIFVAKYAADGTHLWSQRFGGTGSDNGTDIAVDGNGNVVFTGSFLGTVDFGGGPLTTPAATDIFVAKCAGDGPHLWSQRFGGTGSDNGTDIAVDGNGNVVFTGSFLGTVDFGGGPLTSAGGTDIFLVKLSATGQHVWSKRFGAQDD